MNLSSYEAVIGVYTDDEVIALLFPGVETLKKVSPEGSAWICEIVIFVDEVPFVLAVNRIQGGLGGCAVTGVVGCDDSKI